MSKGRIVVGRMLQNHGLDYVKASHGIEENIQIELTGLQKGSYLVFLQLDWYDPSQISSFVISTFSDQHLNLEAADKAEFQPPSMTSTNLLLLEEDS